MDYSFLQEKVAPEMEMMIQGDADADYDRRRKGRKGKKYGEAVDKCSTEICRMAEEAGKGKKKRD